MATQFAMLRFELKSKLRCTAFFIRTKDPEDPVKILKIKTLINDVSIHYPSFFPRLRAPGFNTVLLCTPGLSGNLRARAHCLPRWPSLCAHCAWQWACLFPSSLYHFNSFFLLLMLLNPLVQLMQIRPWKKRSKICYSLNIIIVDILIIYSIAVHIKSQN